MLEAVKGDVVGVVIVYAVPRRAAYRDDIIAVELPVEVLKTDPRAGFHHHRAFGVAQETVVFLPVAQIGR